MKRGLCLALLACPAWAHVVSMSSGDLTVNGAQAHYELRMPLYEISHVRDPERTLLDHVRFRSRMREAKRTDATCHADPNRDLFVCAADYEFAAPVEVVDVECTLAAATVPNHVHLLRAAMGDKRDQAVFDLAFSRAILRFRPATKMETAMEQSAAGFLRALGGPVPALILAALVLAARRRRELLALTAAFLACQAASVLVVPYTGWDPAPRFAEAAAALALAYLAGEILLLPKAGGRWLAAGVLGGFHGLGFHLFARTAGYHPGYVLAGASVAEVIAVAVIALVFSKVGRAAQALRPVQVTASALLVFGMSWFVLRLRG